MIKRNSRKTLLTAMGLAGLMLVCSCGVRGAPEVPAPMWGEADPEKSGETLPEDNRKDTREDEGEFDELITTDDS